MRDAARAPELPGAVPVVFSYADPVLAASTLAGVKTLFMVSAAEAEDRLQTAFRASWMPRPAAGVEHIVYTSFFGALRDCTFTLGRDHYATEERIKASGMDYTFLRDNFYLDFLPLLAGEDGVIRGPAGDGVMAAVTRGDVARCAAAVLRDPARARGPDLQPDRAGGHLPGAGRRGSSPQAPAGASPTTLKPWRKRTRPGHPTAHPPGSWTPG